MINPLDIIRKYYMLDSLAGQSLLIHSQLVRDKAQSLAIRHPEMDLDIPFIQEAAMLHDIGIFIGWRFKEGKRMPWLEWMRLCWRQRKTSCCIGLVL